MINDKEYHDPKVILIQPYEFKIGVHPITLVLFIDSEEIRVEGKYTFEVTGVPLIFQGDYLEYQSYDNITVDACSSYDPNNP